MDDLISRQAAIDALNKIKIYRPLNSDRYVISDCLNKIVNLPNVEVEPVKHGRWEHEIRNTIDSLHTYQQFRCSVCGMTYITNTPYCPNCGARMFVEGEEQ